MSTLIRAETDRPQRLRKIFKGSIDDISTENRTITSVITTDCVDRYKEVIVAKGINLENFLTNPVVLWCHNSTIVIGKNVGLRRTTKFDKSVLIAKTLFAKTEKAEEIFQLYCQGFLNGWSIGCQPDWSKYSAPTDDEIKKRPDWKLARALIRACELTEYSAVSIPANPEALGNELEKLASAELVRAMRESETWSQIFDQPAEGPPPIAVPQQLQTILELPPLIGRTFEQALASVHNEVGRLTSKQAAEKVAQDALDRLKGRV
jgi:hypothetical protein